MNPGIDPKYVFWLGIIVSVELGIGQGVIPLSDMFPADWVHWIKGWSAGLAFIGTTIMTGLSGYSSKTAGPFVKMVAAMAVLLTGLLLGLGQARAADVTFPIKAPAVYVAPTCTITDCSGWYAGIGLTGNGSNANIIGNGLDQSVFSAGGILDVHGGYQLWNGTYFAAAEVGLGNEFTKNQTLASLGGQSIVAYEYVKLGMGLSGLFNPSTASTAPGQAPAAISIPASLAKALMSPYVVFGAQQRRGVSQWVSGAGDEFLLASGWNLDLRYVYAPSQGELPSTNQVTLGINYHFAK